jgi:hypothetical protein
MAKATTATRQPPEADSRLVTRFPSRPRRGLSGSSRSCGSSAHAIKDRGRRTWNIVEGNRRLAAHQLLENPNAAPKELRNQWQTLAETRKKRVTVVPILEYSQRDEVIPYLGFRHITGVMQ